jgi:hypothetical protein
MHVYEICRYGPFVGSTASLVPSLKDSASANSTGPESVSQIAGIANSSYDEGLYIHRRGRAQVEDMRVIARLKPST